MAKARRRLLAPPLVGLALLSAAAGCDTSRPPAGLSQAEAAKTPAIETLRACAACHGPLGVSRAEIFPNLAGQRKDYILAQLTAFRDHTRRDRDAKSYMWGYAARMDPATMSGLSAFYAAQRAAAPSRGAGAEVLAAGEAIYRDGAADRGVVACVSCHGERGEGSDQAPRLAAQHADYLRVQLEAFASGARDNAAMSVIAKALTGADRRAVSTYLARL